MATDEDTQNPFTRPGFIAAAVVIALVVVLGLAIAIINATRAESTPDPEPTTTTSSATTPVVPTVTEDARSASICNLDDGSDTIPVSAPESLWEYQGTTGYPTSDAYGPGKENPAGFRYCFQHSPTGALFAAANAAAQGSDPSVSAAWIEYAAGDGRYRDELMKNVGAGASGSESRLMVQGFRLLKYDENSARVDLGIRASADGRLILVSAVYELVWQNGDWKLSTDTPEPLKTAPIPDLAGYIAWGE